MKIDFRKFCSNSVRSNFYKEPFTKDNYTYATNGEILIRVDSIPEIVITNTLKVEELFESNKINGNEIWIDLPRFEIVERDCIGCKGTGKITICKECNGSGGLQFSSICNVYDVECLSCGGREVVNSNGKCEDCEGTGKYKEYSNPIIETSVKETEEFFGVDETIREHSSWKKIKIMINGMHLEMIQDLPNIKIALQDSSTKVIKLKFDGGIGLLMPMECGKYQNASK